MHETFIELFPNQIASVRGTRKRVIEPPTHKKEIAKMALERTFSIIKPDAVANNVIGEIYQRFEQAGLKVVAAKMVQLSEEQAAGFYAEHEGKDFYPRLKDFMMSGPIMVSVLEGGYSMDALATASRAHVTALLN